jgi:type IV pilus assembly protein PilQ
MIKRRTSYLVCGIIFLMAIGVQGSPERISGFGSQNTLSPGTTMSQAGFIASLDLKVEPKLLVQAKVGEDTQSFYVPPSGKESAPKASTAMLPEEDIFAQLVTLRFKDAEIQNVIRMIADQTGLNIIMARDQVKGIITLDLEDVPLGAALDAILKTHGLAFVREPGGIVRIVPRSEIRATMIELKTVHVPVNWVLATSLSDTLRPFISKAEGAQIQADSESNALIITDTPPTVDTLLALVEKLDVPEKQVMIEMRLVDISRSLLHQLGTEWSLTQAVGTTPIYETETVLNPVTGQVESVIKRVTGSQPAKSLTSLDSVESVGKLYTPGGGRWTWGKDISILGDDFDFDFFLEAYENRNLVSVLANPKVITLNNIKAKIEITEDIPYTTTVIGSGGAQTIQVEFKKAGITLEVLPKITNNGYIRMNLKPVQEIYRGRDPLAQNTPLVDKRSAETNVIVRDEETVVLGGLRQSDMSNITKGTPWFMDIPVLGWLFKSTTDENREMEMVMFVTPHIIKEPSLTEMEKMEYERIDYGWNLPEAFFTQKKED